MGADRKEESAAEVLEEGPDRERATPTGKSGRRSAPGKMGDGMQRRMEGEVEKRGQTEVARVLFVGADLVELDGPLANAVVAFLGAMRRGIAG